MQRFILASMGSVWITWHSWGGECVRDIALFGIAFLGPRRAIPQFNP